MLSTFGWGNPNQFRACTRVSKTITFIDHYENIYAVINGEKHFTLIPPIMYPFLYEGTYVNSNWILDD